MSKKLVAYFSASGVTAKVAERLSESIGADLHDISFRDRDTPHYPAGFWGSLGSSES